MSKNYVTAAEQWTCTYGNCTRGRW